VHLNEPAEDLFGVSRNQAMGRAVRDLLKSNTELEGVVSRARAAGAQYSRREIPFEAGPGAPPRVLDVTVTPFEPPGRSGGVLIELADTTHHSASRARMPCSRSSAAAARWFASSRTRSRTRSVGYAVRRNCSNASSRSRRCMNTPR